MSLKEKEELSVIQRLDLLTDIFNGASIRPKLDQLTDHQLVQAHAFLWDKLVEIHYLTDNSQFCRQEVTKEMVPSSTYQRQQGCDLRLDYCKGVECIWSHPVCAGNKIKNNMEVIANKIKEYLVVRKHDPVTEIALENREAMNILF